MTPAERAEARRWHSREHDGLCRDCHYTYPCHTIRALDALDAAEADAERLAKALGIATIPLGFYEHARAALAAHEARTRG